MLRPRYSLLTLLVLTTLVAGGVKYWRGPHHVVEQKKDKKFNLLDVEMEYSYMRSLLTDRILEGPHVERIFNADGKLHCVDITNYRAGIILSPAYLFLLDPLESEQDLLPKTIHAGSLDDQETQAFLRAILRERERIDELGLGSNIVEGYYFR